MEVTIAPPLTAKLDNRQGRDRIRELVWLKIGNASVATVKEDGGNVRIEAVNKVIIVSADLRKVIRVKPVTERHTRAA